MNYEKYRQKIKNYKDEDSNFDLKSYEQGHNDGYNDGYEDAEFIIISTMHDQWDDFIETCSKCNDLNEIEWINK